MVESGIVADDDPPMMSVWVAEMVKPLATPMHVDACAQEVRVQSLE